MLDNGHPIPSWTDFLGRINAVPSGIPKFFTGVLNGRAVLRFDATGGSDSLQVTAAENPMSKANDFSIGLILVTSSEIEDGSDAFWFD